MIKSDNNKAHAKGIGHYFAGKFKPDGCGQYNGGGESNLLIQNNPHELIKIEEPETGDNQVDDSPIPVGIIKRV